AALFSNPNCPLSTSTKAVKPSSPNSFAVWRFRRHLDAFVPGGPVDVLLSLEPLSPSSPFCFFSGTARSLPEVHYLHQALAGSLSFAGGDRTRVGSCPSHHGPGC